SFLSHALAATYIYTLSLHDALPISLLRGRGGFCGGLGLGFRKFYAPNVFFGIQAEQSDLVDLIGAHLPDPHYAVTRLAAPAALRSEEHTSELQSRFDLVCRLLLEKK